MDAIAHAVDLLADKRRILVFTGAGVSTESGIPDFRGPSGMWQSADPNDFTLTNYLENAEFRRTSWERRFQSPLRHARPNDAHRAVARLWALGRLCGVATQNIDGLHQKAGVPDSVVAELHGHPRDIVCVECGDHPWPSSVERRWLAGDDDPHCVRCGGVLKPTIVYFGESLPLDAVAAAHTWLLRLGWRQQGLIDPAEVPG